MPVPHFSVERHALLSQLACCSEVALSQRYLPRKPERGGVTLFETDLPGDRETFLEQGGHSRLIILGYNEHLSQLGECVSNTPLVPQPPVYRQTLLEQGARPGVLTLAAFEQPLDEERPGGALLVVRRSGECQCFRHQGARCWRVASRPGHIPQ